MRPIPFPALLALLPLWGCAPNGTWGAGNTCLSLDADRSQLAAIEERLARLRAQPPDANRQKEIRDLERSEAEAQAEVRRMEPGCRAPGAFQPKPMDRRY